MRILFISNLYPPNVVGGYERLCFEMAEALADRGHSIQVLTSRYGGQTEIYPNQSVTRSLRLFANEHNIYQPFACEDDQRAEWSRWNISELHRIMAEFQPDRIFVWNLFFFDPSLLEAIAKSGIAPVYLITDNWLIAFLNRAFIDDYMRQRVLGDGTQRWSPSLRDRLRIALRKAPFRLRGRAIFASRFMRSLHAEAGFLFDRSDIVYHGVHLDPHGGRARDRENLRERGRLKLLFAGRLVDLKGVHTAVEALPRIRAALPDLDVRLTIVGDARDQSYLDRLRDIAKAGDYLDAVEFRPPVPTGELFDLFDAHDIYLFPSLYEPFSLTLILAMHAGIPTIASDAGGNLEIVAHRRTGLLFPRADARALSRCAQQLANDDALRARVAAEGARRAARHDFSGMVIQVERILEQAG